MPPPCKHDPLKPQGCKLCHNYLYRPAYRALWDARAKPPCRHLGEPTGERVGCTSCNRRMEVPLRACARHGRCATDHQLAGVASCTGCPDYQSPPRPSADAGVEDLLALLEGDRAGWPGDWVHWPVTADAYRIRFGEVCRQSPANPPWGEGRGIVTCAGGWRFVAGVYTLARVLRFLGSQLPIEVWYLGDHGEYDPCFEALTRGLGVTWIDAQAHARQHGIRVRRWGGWESKSYAVLHSRFRELLFLDADCYPTENPEQWFHWPEYTAHGAAFWPDISHHQMGAPLHPGQWHLWGLPDRREPDFESGQFMVDRSRVYRALCVARWLNDHSDFTYIPGRAGLYGDKSTFHIAFRGAGQDYHMAPPARWLNVAFLQHDPRGRVVLIHRCRDKPRLSFTPDRGLAHSYCTEQRNANGTMVRDDRLAHEWLVHQAVRDCEAMLRPVGLAWREGTQDEALYREAVLLDHYRLPQRFEPGAIVVDIGAHVGYLSRRAALLGATVHAYEPEVANHEMATQNLAGLPVELRRAAVWCHGGPVRLHPGPAGLTGTHTVSDDGDGEIVLAHGLAEVLQRAAAASATGRVALLKLDCEGAEWVILPGADLSCVDRIAGEYHLRGAPDWASPDWLRGHLEAQGFAVEVQANPGDEALGMIHAIRPGT